MQETNELIIISFCEDGDLLSQWRGYRQKQSGISMGFMFSELINRFFEEKSNDRIMPLKVVYEDKLKRLILGEILRIGLVSASKHEEWFFEDIAKMILESFHFYIPLFKHESFSEEREWRSIHINYSKAKKSGYPVLFRQRGAVLLPYICLRLHKSNDAGKSIDPHLPLTEVIVGPSSTSDLTKESISYFLNKQDMESVTIRKSSIPFQWE